MAFQLASLFVRISAETSSVDSKIDKTGKAVNRLYWQMERLRRAAVKMFAVLGGTVVGVTYAFAKFDAAMAQLRGTTEATDAEFEALKGRAKELGSSTVFSATEVAQAMTTFALAGFNVKETFDSIPHVLRLSQVGMIDLAKGTQIAVNVMRGMGQDVKLIGNVIDVLATAGAKSSTDIAQLGESFKAFGPLALNTGASLKDVASSFMVLAETGRTAESAGTAMRNVFLRLLKPTKEIKKALKELGVSISDSAGNMLPLADIIDALNVALSKKTQTAKNDYITTIAGMRAVTSFTTLLQKGGSELRTYAKELGDSSKFAKNFADIQNATLSASFERLKNRVQVLAINLGELLVPTIKVLMNVVNRVLTTFESLSDNVKQAIIEFIAIGAAVSGVGIIAATLVVIVVSITSALGVTVLAITAAAVAFIELGVEGDNLGEKFKNLQKIIGLFNDESSASLSSFQVDAISVFAQVETHLKHFKATFQIAFYGLAYAVESIVNDISYAFVVVLPRAIEYFAVAFLENLRYLSQVVLPAYVDFIYENWTTLWNDIITFTKQVFLTLGVNFKNFFESLWKFLKSGFTDSFEFTWTEMLKGFKRTTAEMATIAPRVVGPVEQSLKDAYEKSQQRAETESEKSKRLFITSLTKELDTISNKRWEDLVMGFFGSGRRPPKLPEGLAKTRPDQKTGTEGRVTGKGATFIGIDELAKKIQLAAVGGNMPEQQLAEQKKGNELLKNVNSGIKDVGKKLDKGLGFRITK